MTTGEYVQVKTKLLESDMIERIEFLAAMPFKKLAEFTDRLMLQYSEPMVLETWRIVAKTLACRSLELIAEKEKESASVYKTLADSCASA